MAGLVPVEEIEDCDCCGDRSGSGLGLEACTCPTTCTPTTRYLTIVGCGSPCDGTWPLTCSIQEVSPGIFAPAWDYYPPGGLWGEDILLGYTLPCDVGTNWIFRFYCVDGFYILQYRPPGEGAQNFFPIEQQCNPLYAKFDFSQGIAFSGLVSCCDYVRDGMGGNYGVVTD